MSSSPIPIHRSFVREVEKPVRDLPNVRVESLVDLSYPQVHYPLLCVRYPASSRSLPVVLVSAGLHGDEPAGVHAIIDFLRDRAASFSQFYEFVFFPCVNPSGYEANTLETIHGINLNREFGSGTRQREVHAIESWLERLDIRFRVTFDLHEAPPYYEGEGFVRSDNPPGTYLYETVTDGSPRIGHRMIASLPDDLEVCRWATIYGDINDNGVISYPEACRNPVYARRTSLDAYLNGRYTGHSFTTETPTFWPYERRVATHRCYLETALRFIADEVCDDPAVLAGSRGKNSG